MKLMSVLCIILLIRHKHLQMYTVFKIAYEIKLMLETLDTFLRQIKAENVQNLYVSLPRKHSNGLKAYIVTHEAVRADSILIFLIIIILDCFLYLPPFWTDLAVFHSWIACLKKQCHKSQQAWWNDVSFVTVHVHKTSSKDAQQKGKGIKCN